MNQERARHHQSELADPHPYNKQYYDHYHTDMGPVPYVREQGPWLPLFRAMAEYIDLTIKPGTVLDAGCAKGFLVEALRDRGVDASGIDISEYAIGEVRPDVRPYCRAASLVDPFPARYDLVVCIEVLEHLTETEGKRAIANICASTSDVLFSSSPDDFDEPTHVTVRPRSYWVERFAEEGFTLDAEFDARAIAPHAMRFRKRDSTMPLVDVLLDQRDRFRNDLELLKQQSDERLRSHAIFVAGLQSRLHAIEQSMGWKMVERMRRVRDGIAPPGTVRCAWYVAVRQGLRSIIDDGAVGAFKKLVGAVGKACRPRMAGGAGENALADSHHPAIVFKEHALAHSLLDGLAGLEIGPAAHNPFGLKTRTVELMDSREFYASVQQNVMGVTPPAVDIWASADRIPLPDRSEDFILSSHVVEHLPNVIAAFVEWNRIIKDGGYVFMIVPLPWALPADRGRELTSFEHFIDDYRQHMTLDTHPVDGVPGGRMGHYHTFVADSLLHVVQWMCQHKLCDWELVAREDIDTKVGNGFTLAFKVRHARTGAPASKH